MVAPGLQRLCDEEPHRDYQLKGSNAARTPRCADLLHPLPSPQKWFKHLKTITNQVDDRADPAKGMIKSSQAEATAIMNYDKA
jgi:hypothetical protein